MTPNELQSAYIELVKKSVGDFIYDFDQHLPQNRFLRHAYQDPKTGRALVIKDYQTLRENGLTPVSFAHTMIGLKRLNNIQACVETVLQDQLEGDFLEAGVWRGGACIFMRALLKAYGIKDKKVWLADSFEGFHPEHRETRGFTDTKNAEVAVSLAQVKANFERYGLLDEQVIFLPGYFEDSLPQADLPKLSLLRLDADLYPSTMTALTHLYPRLEVGGFIIIDDYFGVAECFQAVTEFRHQKEIQEEIQVIDPTGVFWRKEA